MKSKRCSRCGEVKALSEYHKGRANKDGHKYTCKACDKAAYMTGTCPDCGAAIYKDSKRCNSCSLKAVWKRGVFDSEETRRKMSENTKAAHERGDMDGEETRRKLSEAAKARWANGAFDNEETRRKMSEGIKAAHARGDFDGAYTSPSKPELAIAQALDDLGIEYETQYRLEGDGRPFDFLIGDDLLLEVDGVYWHSLPGRAESDGAKTALAEDRGYRLVRVTDLEIVERGAETIVREILQVGPTVV